MTELSLCPRRRSDVSVCLSDLSPFRLQHDVIHPIIYVQKEAPYLPCLRKHTQIHGLHTHTHTFMQMHKCELPSLKSA